MKEIYTTTAFLIAFATSNLAQLPGAVINRRFQANQKGDYHTQVHLKAGDYVYIEAWDKVEISEVLGTKIDASGSDNFFFNLSYNKYGDFKHAALLCKINGTDFIQPFTAKLFEQVPSIERLFVKDMGYLTGKGEYPGVLMLAPYDGELVFEINDTKIEDNKGSFNIFIYRLTQQQHQQRNRYNRCPRSEMKVKVSSQYERDRIGTFRYHTDADQSEWDRLQISGYRGIGNRFGCQCIYDVNGDLINNGIYMGTFDYALARPEYRGSKFMHYILDVIPHLMYKGHLISDETMYEPTPAINIDP